MNLQQNVFENNIRALYYYSQLFLYGVWQLISCKHFTQNHTVNYLDCLSLKTNANNIYIVQNIVTHFK